MNKRGVKIATRVEEKEEEGKGENFANFRNFYQVFCQETTKEQS